MDAMGTLAAVEASPWIVALVAGGSVVLITGLLFGALHGRRGHDLRAWVSAVGRSEAIRIDAGSAQGIRVGQTLVVHRSVASRVLDGRELATVARHFVSIGRARVVTVGNGEALCRFMPEPGLASAVRAGDFVSNRDWTVSRRRRNTPAAA